MKSLYPNSAKLNTRNYKTKTILFVFLLTLSFSSSFSQGHVFQNARLESGKAGADKAVYRFPNAKPGVDALVTIKGRSSAKVTLENIDVTSSGHPKAFQPQVSYNAGTAVGRVKWYMDFEVAFVKAGTTTRVQADEVDVTAIDVDGNGDKIREFIVFTDPVNVINETVTSLVVDELPVIDFDAENGDALKCPKCSKSSPIVLCNGGCNGSGLINTLINGILQSSNCSKCSGTGKLYSLCGHSYTPKKSTGLGSSYEFYGPETNYSNIDTFATSVMVTGTWLNTDEVTFRVGAENFTNGSSGAADRLYSLYFKSFRYLGMTFLPSTMTNWKAEVVKNNVQLKWTTTIERNASHYIIERSLDGKNYTEAGRVEAGVNSENRKDYSFMDNIMVTEGTIYYRLKSADLDGKFRVSDVRTVRIGKANSPVGIKTFPNPLVNELKVSLPSNWQGKKVSMNIYSVNGVLVKQIEKNTASPVETIDVQQLRAGTYVVKVISGTETATQQVIK